MYQNIFDSHAHYDDERFDSDRAQVLSELPSHGICAVINIASDLPSSRRGLHLAQEYPYIWCAVGIHPHAAGEVQAADYDELRRLAKDERVVAIGEIGLDYHYDFSEREAQRAVFERQLQLAEELSLPVVIHTREATEDTLVLLRRYRPRGVVHCYTGSPEVAREILSLGMYIGFTGAVTFKNARRVVDSAAIVPLDRLLVETDCPYMAPEPYRGRRCDSSMLEQTGERIAAIRQMEPQELFNLATENTCRLFQIQLP